MLIKYDYTDGGCDWYEGIIVTFNCISGKYGVFFPSDNTSEEFSLNEEGFVINDIKVTHFNTISPDIDHNCVDLITILYVPDNI